MSAGGLSRGIYRFAEWTLKADPESAVRYVGKCLTCSERCADTAAGDDAQLWCLKHAGITGHGGYELWAFQYFTASMADPAGKPVPAS
ncbi:hypothetical protein OG453_04320 [Streptomyces sp. NBC_01381]|uniref:DUF7848 domain-containing protein n=1 Tax=Streptomyces sp. NBC_01381 TaxID=2903845 RepID=UPI00224DBC81|nr:hypothetical protein [Streptomyces sp. NBC_01381]MCX4665904.1 hypothetical protein [Streptomyces sp. NBC_01381]